MLMPAMLMTPIISINSKSGCFAARRTAAVTLNRVRPWLRSCLLCLFMIVYGTSQALAQAGMSDVDGLNGLSELDELAELARLNPVTKGEESRVSVSDDLGNLIELARPARRIISLSSHVTEMLFAAGAGGQVVGVSADSDYPLAVHRLPRVGGLPRGSSTANAAAAHGGERYDLAAITALRPDLLIVRDAEVVSSQLTRLKNLKVPLYFSKPRRLEDIATNIERYGKLAASEEIARQAAQGFRARHGELRKRFVGRSAVRIFYQLDQSADSRLLTTVNDEQLQSDVMQLCGAQNVFAHHARALPTVTLEEVLLANPEAVVVSGIERGREQRAQRLEMWRHWPELAANQLDNYFFISSELINRPGPRLLDGAQRLCEQMERARTRRLEWQQRRQQALQEQQAQETQTQQQTTAPER